MKNRYEIRNLINEKKEEINRLKNDIVNLHIEDYKLCDEIQYYEEKEEEFVVSKRPKKVEKHLVGRIYWIENIKDYPSNGNDFKLIPIKRSKMVRKDNVWYI